MSPQPKASHGVALTADVWASICEQIAAGKSVAAICKAKSMPSKQTVFKHLADNEAMRAEYEAAKLLSADALADDVLEISDTAKDAESAQVAKVRMAARQWYAEKLNPKKFGPRADVNLGGGVRVEIVDVLADD